MNRLYGFFSPTARPVSTALERLGGRLSPPEAQAVAFGLTFSHGDQTLLRRRPLLTRRGEVDLPAETAELQTTALLAQVIEGQAPSIHDTPPFRYGPWGYGQVGDLPGDGALRASFYERLPDSLQRNVQGQSSAELFFHLFLSHLRDTGISPMSWNVGSAEVVATIADALRDWRATAQGANHADPIRIAGLLTSGQSCFALALGLPIYALMVRLGGRVQDLPWDSQEAPDAVLIASQPCGDGFTAVESGHVLCIEKGPCPSGPRRADCLRIKTLPV